MSQFLTKAELAEMLSVDVQTIQKWARERKLPVLVLPNGHYRYERSKIEKFIKERSIGVMMVLIVLFSSCGVIRYKPLHDCSSYSTPCTHGKIKNHILSH
jgi:excisionase family DNA binding protein